MTWNYKGKADGAKLLIDSMGLILKSVPESRLIIAAKAMHDGYAQEIEAYLAGTEWHHAVTILYNQRNIPDLLANSDIFVYATAAESNDSLPRALLEAHAAGLPIVTTATSGCPEIVDDAVTGFVIPYAAPSMAQRVIELLANPVRRQEMGRLGRQRVDSLFNWNRMGQEYANLFSALLATKHTATSKIVRRAGQGNSL
jgi:glycosyltransferase involved in cell wall biosynthesis